MHKALFIFSVLLSGCAMRSTYNVIDITDDQWIEDKDGNRCIEGQMLIEPDRIIYYYKNCPFSRIVKPKQHPLPKPQIK